MSAYDDNCNYVPRPTAEVYRLRKAGLKNEAYDLAKKLFKAGPDDPDNLKALAWTLIDLCKVSISEGDMETAEKDLQNLEAMPLDDGGYDEFTQSIIKQIKALRLKLSPYYNDIMRASQLSKDGSNDEAYLIMSRLYGDSHLPSAFHESYGWIIYRYLRDHIAALSSVQVRSLLRDYIRLENGRPSLLHSQILNFALNYSKHDPAFRFISFLKLWGPEYLRRSDFEDSQSPEGKKIPSLMSRIAREVIRYPEKEVYEFLGTLRDAERHDRFVEMLRESCFWNIYSLIEDKRTDDAADAFDSYASTYAAYGPSEWHSNILSLAERSLKDGYSGRFFAFFRCWYPPENFMREDWYGQEGENGVKYKPLAIKALKKAKEYTESDAFDSTDSLGWLIDAYSDAIARFPDDEWLLRDKATLCIKEGNRKEAESIYRELSTVLGDKYYIWQEFSECVEDPDIRIAMLCKALSIEKNGDFTGKLHLELAGLLADKGMYANARTEALAYKNYYESKGWKVNALADSILAKSSRTSSDEDNASLYEAGAKTAEEYAYSGLPEIDFTLIDDWKDADGKRHQRFLDRDSNEMVLNPRHFPGLETAKPGQVWTFRCKKKTEAGAGFLPLAVKKKDTADWSLFEWKYGHVGHVNKEKKAYHIFDEDSNPIFAHYGRQEFTEGDFVRFREYSKKISDRIRFFAVEISKCTEDEAIPHFRCRLAGVDDVNEKKRLFHFVLGPGKISGILHYDRTDLRPAVGDFLYIHYYVRQKKETSSGAVKKVIEVLKAEPSFETDPEIVRTISGDLCLKYRGETDWFAYNGNEYPSSADFAFIGDYYVHKSILSKYRITSDCHVTAQAIYTGDGKWKVFKIYKDQE